MIMEFYCNGKKGICDCNFLCQDCGYFDDSGGKEVNNFWAKIIKWFEHLRRKNNG